MNENDYTFNAMSYVK